MDLILNQKNLAHINLAYLQRYYGLDFCTLTNLFAASSNSKTDT